MMRSALAAALFLLLLSPLPAAADPSCLRIGISNGGVTSQASGELVLKIFARAGLCAQLVQAPQYRVTAMEDRGELDGDAWRVPAYFDSHPVLTPVPTAVDLFRGSLYWRSGQAEPKGDHQSVGILLGAFWARLALRESGIEIFEANSYEQLFRQMESGHVQGFVMPSYSFKRLPHPELDALGLTSREVYASPLHLAIARRQQALVPRLDAAIRELTADGTIAAMLALADR